MQNSQIIKYLRKRIYEQNKNALVVIAGDTGSGKSYGSFGLCRAFDPTFTPKRVAYMKASGFMNILRTKNLKRGNAIMWDDVGKGLKAKEWYELINRVITDILQTFRVRGLLVVFNVPDITFIDSTARKLFHYQGEMVAIDMKNKFGIMKFFEIQVNRRSGKSYYKYPVVKIGGIKKKITRFRVKMPPKKLIREYERKKKIEYMRLEEESEKIIEKIEEKSKRKLFGDKEIIEDIVKRADVFTKTYQGRTFIDPFMIMGEFEIGRLRSSKIKSTVEKMLDFHGEK